MSAHRKTITKLKSIAKRYAKGESIASLAKIALVSSPCLRRHLERIGVEIRHR